MSGTATRSRSRAAAPEPAVPAALAFEASGRSYVPRAPQRRGEVYSRTPLRLREKVAAFRCWWHDDPRKTRSSLVAGSGVLTLEHYRSTFPAIQHAAPTTLHVIAWMPQLVGVR